jgi:hypothetical protein
MHIEEPWYSVKCIFRHEDLSQNKDDVVYEERIIVLNACNLDEAIALGEAEAKAYASGDGTIRFTGFVSAFHIYVPELAEGAEVYSLMRRSTLDIDAFLDHYYDDGTELAQPSHNENQDESVG